MRLARKKGETQRVRKKLSSSRLTTTPIASAESDIQTNSAAGAITAAEAGVSVAKAVLGAGSFALPWAFAQGGWLLASCVNATACVAAALSLQMLCTARSILLSSKIAPEALADYAGIARSTLGQVGALVTEVLVLLTCLGLCSAYLVFIASTARSLLPHLAVHLSHSAMVALSSPVLALLAWLRQMRGVSTISALGTVSVVAGIAFVSKVALCTMSPSMSNIPAFEPSAFSRFWGSVAFLFFVHFSLPPIQASMAQPNRFMPVAWATFATCGIIANAFGLLGASAFGVHVDSVVVSELGSGIMSSFVKLLLVANLLCTFPLVARSAFEIVEKWLGAAGVHLSTWSSRAVRSAFVFVAAAGAICIPSFGSILGYVGGIALSIISLVFPPIILLQAKAQCYGTHSAQLVERTALLAFSGAGVIVMGVSAVL